MYSVLIIVCAALLAALDQITKWLAEQYLKGKPFVIWDGVFELHYAENTGAAFGILEGYRFVLIAIPLVVMAALYYFTVTGKLGRSKLLTFSVTLIISGGLGNLIDRIFREKVIDFLYFKLINFPIFNVADCFVVVGSLVLLFYFLFLYKENIFEPSVNQTYLPSEPVEGQEDILDGVSEAESPSGENWGEA
jgi:signal peptidase II